MEHTQELINFISNDRFNDRSSCDIILKTKNKNFKAHSYVLLFYKVKTYLKF